MPSLINAGTIFFAVFAAGAAVGQTTPSTSEQQVDGINRSLLQQGRILQRDEQNEFNSDQMLLRQDQRNEENLQPSTPYRRGCPIGSTGC